MSSVDDVPKQFIRPRANHPELNELLIKTYPEWIPLLAMESAHSGSTTTSEQGWWTSIEMHWVNNIWTCGNMGNEVRYHRKPSEARNIPSYPRFWNALWCTLVPSPLNELRKQGYKSKLARMTDHHRRQNFVSQRRKRAKTKGISDEKLWRESRKAQSPWQELNNSKDVQTPLAARSKWPHMYYCEADC